MRRAAALLAGLLVLAPIATTSGGPAGASNGISASAQPSAALGDRDPVGFSIKGADPGSHWIVAECGPKALSFQITPGSPPAQDGCEQRQTDILVVGPDGRGAVGITAFAVLTTAAGAADCRQGGCFIAAQRWGGSGLAIAALSFAPDACAIDGCPLPADAWDPIVGSPAQVSATGLPVSTGGGGLAQARPGAPATLDADLTASPGLPLVPAGASSVPGYSSQASPRGAALDSGGAVDGILQVAMSAPGTSWGGLNPSSVVADVRLRDLTSSTETVAQQVVLFAGADRFDYALRVGSLVPGHRYAAEVSAEPSRRKGGLSELPPKQVARIDVFDVSLLGMDPGSSDALLQRFAPILLGRSTSALHDVPLLLDAKAQDAGNGLVALSYTEVFSHEDAGTAYVPLLEWSAWGRLTDIETVVSLVVDPATSTVISGTYASGGVPKRGWPDSDGARSESSQPLPAQGTRAWEGTHPIIRVATGNNDVLPGGSSRFRFEQMAVPGPADGASRESVMAAYPFTDSLMAQEADRWYAVLSTATSAPLEGRASQYAAAELDVSAPAGTRMALRIEMGGQWSSSDAGLALDQTTFGPGHVRTTVKLPLGWTPEQIQAAEIAVYGGVDPADVHAGPLTLFVHSGLDSTTAQQLDPPGAVAASPAMPVVLSPAAGTTPINSRSVLLSAGVLDLAQQAVPMSRITLTASGDLSFSSCSCAELRTTTGRLGGIALRVHRGGAGGTIELRSSDPRAAPVQVSVPGAG